MDRIITVERLRDREHLLHAYCHVCDRWRMLNLEEMLQQWSGMVSAPDEVQCTTCGHLGLLKVRRRPARHVVQEPSAVAGWSLAV